MRIRWILISFFLVLLIAACGDDDGGGSADNPLSTTPSPRLGAPQCEEAGERACNNHSTLFAIAHSFTDPENTVLYRVEIPAWDLGFGWQSGRNGLFYRAKVSDDASICVDPLGSVTCAQSKVYVPFNGARFDGDTEEPSLPPFSFIVPITGGDPSATTLTIEACFASFQGSSFDEEPPCTDLGWTNVYAPSADPLPVPSVGLPSGFTTTVSAELIGTTAVSIPNTGVHPGVLIVRPSSTLDDVGLDFFYDHLIFFDQTGNPFTNDIFDGTSTERRSAGVLTIEEAAYPISAQEYRTKYGNMQTLQAVTSPDKQFFFYTADEIASTAIRVGVGYIYDGSDGCLGTLPPSGSNAETCSPFLVTQSGGVTSGVSQAGTFASITPLDNAGNAIPLQQENGLGAGDRENRTVLFESAGSGSCPRVVNPLAANLGGGYFSAPNYVIRRAIDDSRFWGRDFANAMYFVLPTGFGNCASTDAPFCADPSGSTSYDAYVPHYLNTAGTSTETLNGGGTNAAVVGGFTLADQYTLGSVGEAAANSIVYFDNCGYGYVYSEGQGSGTALGSRQNLPDPPENRDTYTYRITNDLDSPIVFGKECCASYYQSNTDDITEETYLEPPVELDDGFGVFVAAGATVQYRTLFEDEAMVIYDATTGDRIGKMRLNLDAGALYGCNDSSLAVQVTRSSDVLFDVGVGIDKSDSLKCEAIGPCPFAMTPGLTEGNISCTLTTSSFVLGVADWAEEVAGSPVAVQLRAWGGTGEDGVDFAGGVGGFSATALSSDSLPDNLLAYLGRGFTSNRANGGSSTVLTAMPLSSVSEPENVTDPGTVGILLLAGGGGGGPGARGAVAIASTSRAASARGGTHDSSAGEGGNQDGLGTGSGGGTDGIGGHGGGGVDWNRDGALIQPDSWGAGKGGGSGLSGGGGGFGGAAGGSAAGGGGGWAARATVSGNLPSSNSVPDSPGDRQGGVQLLYNEPNTDGTANCYTEDAGGGRTNGVCELIAGTVFDLTELPALVGASPSSVIWIQAWGGRGGRGKGSDAEPGGDQGTSGFAQTVTTIDSYQSTFGTTSMHVYLGGADSSGHNAGKGGAATIVSSVDLTAQQTSIGASGNIVLVAAGGGGGSHAQPTHSGHKGGAGGVAIATTSGNANGCGSSGGSGGGSGAHGKGGCGGSGGDGGGSNDSHNGRDGVGGYGGSVHAGGSQTSPQGWTNKTPSEVGDDGRGGNGGNGNGGVGGAGGGGYGGGGGGNGGGSTYAGGGGGGGGSWAIRSTHSDSNAPTSRPSPGQSDGLVAIVFPNL